MCKVLERRGWRLARTKSSHHIYKKPGVAAIITVPVQATKTSAPALKPPLCNKPV